MSKKLVYLMFLVIILTGALVASTNVHKVKATYPIIYIRADGSIDPSTANITSSDKVMYTFTANINASIIVQRSDIIIDGNGCTLQGYGSGIGFNITTNSTLVVSNVTIKNVRIKGFQCGIYVHAAGGYTISENRIENNTMGICVDATSAEIFENNITSNVDGVVFQGGYYAISGGVIAGNNIIENRDSGVSIYGTHCNHRFFHNNFKANSKHVGYVEYPHFWDNGVEGNYWSNYTGIDSNHDGVGDSPHVVYSFYGYTDNYPLMGPFNSFNTSVGERVDTISNSTINDFKYFKSNSTIIMRVSNMTGDQAFGFCRIRIPHALMNETYHVTINSSEPYYENYTLYDDGENSWIYFSYQHSTLEIVIVPELSSFVILSLFMMATLLAVIFYRRKYSM